ncbi:TrbC/VirB2 family protein [Oceaniglobus indicus]|uniref:TrbC/VirB2 family protein n=1 Tax=Oceaniglobus indicus TaxID=2047749 RepID=UPI000C194B02|nr:TrbC/VirB2 family protein [Oceaniglobus indicus]
MFKHSKLAAIFALSFLPGAAFASTRLEIFETSCGYLTQIQTWLFGAAYVMGAIGLVIIAVSAFLGRFKFSHLIALGGGLFIVAMADALLSFITNDQGDTTSCTGAG